MPLPILFNETWVNGGVGLSASNLFDKGHEFWSHLALSYFRFPLNYVLKIMFGKGPQRHCLINNLSCSFATMIQKNAIVEPCWYEKLYQFWLTLYLFLFQLLADRPRATRSPFRRAGKRPRQTPGRCASLRSRSRSRPASPSGSWRLFVALAWH